MNHRILRPFSLLKISALLVACTATAGVASARTRQPQGKPFPSGIIRFFATNVDNPEDDPSWDNLNLDGVRLRPVWTDIAPNAGVAYDWSSVDAIFAIAAEHGRIVGLSVGAGVNTPGWVYTAGAARYHLLDGSGLTMSLPWDPVFQSKYLPLVRAMGKRYDGNPNLGYIVIGGLGQNIETYLSQTAADDAALTALGGLPAWITAAEKIISAYASAFPTTPIFITAARVLTSDVDQYALSTVLEWGVATYPGRFGIMTAGLNAKSSTVYYPNQFIYDNRATQPVGFQMLCSSILDRQRLLGTLQEAMDAGVNLGGEFIEVYQSDADAPKNQAVLASEGDRLEANLP